MSEYGIQKIAEELTNKICGQYEANLFESIISLFNQGVLVHRVTVPRVSDNSWPDRAIDTDKCSLTVEAASAVTFEGREKIIELQKQNDDLEAKLKVATDVLSSIENDCPNCRAAYVMARKALEDFKKDDALITKSIDINSGNMTMEAIRAARETVLKEGGE